MDFWRWYLICGLLTLAITALRIAFSARFCEMIRSIISDAATSSALSVFWCFVLWPFPLVLHARDLYDWVMCGREGE